MGRLADAFAATQAEFVAARQAGDGAERLETERDVLATLAAIELTTEVADLRDRLATAERERDTLRATLAATESRLAAAERVVEAAREPTVCNDHWCAECKRCKGAEQRLADALRAYSLTPSCAQCRHASGKKPTDE